MRRCQFLTAAAGAAVAAGARSPLVHSQPPLEWRMVASWPKSLDTIFGACETTVRARTHS